MAEGGGVSRQTELGWRGSPPSLGRAAVDAVLACNAVTLCCGPHTFDFVKTRTPLRDVELRLSHRKDCACEGDVHVRGHRDRDARSIERLIPAVTNDLDDATRVGLEEQRLSTVGRALFAHVARLIVDAESEPRGKRTLRFTTVTGKYSRRSEVHRRGRVCAIPGCGTLLSTYNPSSSCALHYAGSPLPKSGEDVSASRRRETSAEGT
jgi:hypothetical protein